MVEQRVVLITGVSGFWGSRLAQRLLEEPELRVIGLDAEAPQQEIDGLDFVRADIRNPLLPDLLRSEEIDSLCHLAFQEAARHSEAAFDYNVMGTMKVIAAAAASGVRQVVLRSSTLVYGAHPDNSAFLRESSELRGSRRDAMTRYQLEIESFLNGFRRQAPEIDLAVLRFAHVVGPEVSTPMSRYLKQPLPPVLLGFDPMLQVIHEDDAVEALAQAVIGGSDGCINVAADPPLPLLRILGLASKMPLPLPHPLAYRSRFRALCPIEANLLRFRCVADLTTMRDELEFTPQYSSDQAIESVAVHRRINQYKPGTEAADHEEERLRATIERRRKNRARMSSAAEQIGAPIQAERKGDHG
jgi:UDP-glucose 4-epimerase